RDWFIKSVRVMKIGIINSKGKQFVQIVDSLYSPITDDISVNYANLFLESEKHSLAVNSKLSIVQCLIHSLTYFKNTNIDIYERVSSGEFFIYKELDEFANHASLKKEYADLLESESIVSITQKSIISPHAAKSTFREQSVKYNTIRKRLRSFREFIEYLSTVIHGVAPSNEVEGRKIDTTSFLSREIKKYKGNKDVEPVDIDEQMFSEEILDKLNEVIQIGHKYNPFKPSVQARNKAIIDVLFGTGLRKGALLALKIGDVRGDGIERLLIAQRENYDDTRKYRPSQKTAGKAVYIERKDFDILDDFIVNHRYQFVEKGIARSKGDGSFGNVFKNHDFVFVSSKGSTVGQPLSISSFNRIFMQLSSALGVDITPHKVRYHWNYEFTKTCKEAGLDQVETAQLRKRQMTWSRDSKMEDVYNERALLEKVREHKQKMQRRIG
ncbi:hypothetical protein UB33_21690, partial [Photobacterium angustum]|uniref:site-specific integrase n=1 Tax=Photobacterium angustum TaxID=661 RepID=UPI0005E91B1E